jgi:hypothetical protein
VAGLFGFGEIVAVAMLSDVFDRDDDVPDDHPVHESRSGLKALESVEEPEGAG